MFSTADIHTAHNEIILETGQQSIYRLTSVAQSLRYLMFWRFFENTTAFKFLLTFTILPFLPGLKLQGAECSRNVLSLSNIITTDLPNTCLTWKHVGGVVGNTGEMSPNTDLVQLPVYLNQTRVELLFTVDMKTSGEVPSRSFYERGVAFLSSFLTG